MQYNFREIEKKWQQTWKDKHAYQVSNNSTKPKCYILDMFPYPSGAGLHVGHPLGYIASDIYARYKRLDGFNVLHPMGFDAFGLPAEQYALETGQHPAVTTAQNIARYKEQLDNIGFCFDWSREVKTSDPQYYKWTQWIFLQLYNSWYNPESNKAEPIETIVENLKNSQVQFQEWDNKTFAEQEEILMQYRLAFRAESLVNWCEALGTVLANDEVVNGVSERGGHPVERKKMSQWFLRITDFAERLLDGLDKVDFPESLKEMQRNWIGKSVGAEINFELDRLQDASKQHQATCNIFTTRPDTIFGVSFMVLAPEHELVNTITTSEQKPAIEAYQKYVSARSERERLAETKQITGCFTGAYAIHPFTRKPIPIWVSEYVLIGYGTGAIMAVPCGDERDYAFAKHFNLPIPNIFKDTNIEEAACTVKNVAICNSDFLNDLSAKDAIQKTIDKLEELKIGTRKINYRMRDAGFSRQRYWGEPFPIVYNQHNTAIALTEVDLPVQLPHLETYSAGPNGKGPLANAKEWMNIVGRVGNEDLTPNPSPRGEGNETHNSLSSSSSKISSDEKKEAQQYGSKIFTTDPASWIALKEFARENRNNQTEAEEVLWQQLRNNKIGSKVRRQHVIENYIADFYFADAKLIIEVDGEIHATKNNTEYDNARTTILNQLGFEVLRFKNNDVIDDTDTVVEKITNRLIELSSGFNPSHEGKGQGVRSNNYTRETDTMPGYAGSSWYYLRYMDPQNETTFCDRKISDYWNQVDVYVGGAEHAVGHLLYSRMWCKALYDLGHIGFDEPYKKLINQGMIQGSSRFFYRFNWPTTTDANFNQNQLPQLLISKNIGEKIIALDSDALQLFFHWINNICTQLNLNFTFDKKDIDLTKIHVDVNLVDGVELQVEAFKKFKNSAYENAQFLLEDDGKFICSDAVEKMSKSKYNVVNPDLIIEQYGTDTFRMYEMFLGPLDVSKPWDTKGIEGVHRFLKKLWRLYMDENTGSTVQQISATTSELKILHKTIKKIKHDTENFAFNTAVSQFMITVNELSALKCNKKEILEPLLILLTPYAPHISEALWHSIGNTESILDATFPSVDESFLVENTYTYPVAINGKTRTEMTFPLDIESALLQEQVFQNEIVSKWIEGQTIKKFIYVKGKMINVVI